ncbi:hypothetical protein GWK47_026430 [Chionoecetes opilio]|uniref:Uncharacterized protein n=1 Tax=Chionoecetes opilio TaxID=41210 RepID=A0A8J8WEL0_CHIOP|nr:hypothetical protein GWK47_026430 [Chionoecetes opilio]
MSGREQQDQSASGVGGTGVMERITRRQAAQATRQTVSSSANRGQVWLSPCMWECGNGWWRAQCVTSVVAAFALVFCEGTIYGVVWLLEKSPTSSFPGNRLSSRGEVLQVFLFHHKTQKEVLFAAAAFPLGVLEVWRRREHSDVGIVVGEEERSSNYEEAPCEIQVTEEGRGEEMKRCIFRDSLEDMFDIAHSKGQWKRRSRGRQGFLGGSEGGPGRVARWLGVDEKLKRAMRRSDLRHQQNVHPVDLLRRISPTKELTLAWGADNLSIRAATSSYALLQ